METKTARLTLLIDPDKKAAFERLCAERDLTASQVVRQLIRDYLADHGASYVPSGHADSVEEPAEPTSATPAGHGGTTSAKAGTARRGNKP